MDYEQEFERLKASTLTLITESMNQANNTQFNVVVNGQKVIQEIGSLRPDRLRGLMGKPSVTLGAVDGSCSVDVFGDTVFISVAAASLIYEMVSSDTVWIEKWPEQGVKYSFILPVLAHQAGAESSDSSLYFANLASNLMKLLEFLTLADTMSIADIVLSDGSLSMDYKTSVNASINERLYKKTRLNGLKTGWGELDEYDLLINLYRGLDLLVARPPNPFALIFSAERNGGTVVLDGVDGNCVRQLQAFAAAYPDKIQLSTRTLTLSQEAMKSWDRLTETLALVRQNIALNRASHPLVLLDRPLGLDDIDLLRAYAFIDLLLKAKHLGKLLISVAKDSTSTSLQELIFGGTSPTKRGFILPDKLALEVYSALREPTLINEPWSTIEYDPLSESNPTSNELPMQGVFSRFYVQLMVTEGVRSDVVVCERLKRRAVGVFPPYYEMDDPDREYTLGLLLALSQPTCSIPEALGHIYPLFEVDKYVKHIVSGLGSIVKGYQKLLITDPAYREYLSIIKPFRQKRSEFERGRRSWAQTR
ncbi:hypothetical protein B9Q06_06710 [Candidatus Marsarchaeota G2 archaeon ECH_B_2]|uniref:NurA domain-containing protein n=4 Tax=Candidatus Marsarchaeota group 2 TaxID=2203771 RepID=A0A2R6B8Z7_9ARCH|nr:MAG: hypothetical protein B9Q06_06710 [Candidatus Marsarchaeota G2 archaeon ECH_B_2]PSN99750.1 MAG: hypothetical protein B9Q07_05875 [Candidatus Marsarchaeota G2 archaeon ECH_B_3]PSO01975.1 MAG: hypothetical protein B9Q05_06820 [Candidatus Marsarchaeota G2 archaeon ECH_B_1]